MFYPRTIALFLIFLVHVYILWGKLGINKINDEIE